VFLQGEIERSSHCFDGLRGSTGFVIGLR